MDFSLSKSKSVLSLSNPYEKVMKKAKEQNEPIIENCQMILSKKLNAKPRQQEFTDNKHPLSVSDLNSSPFQRSSAELKHTKVGKKNKENDIWQTKTKCQTNGKTNMSMKNSMVPTGKGKLSISERASLSRFLINKFN